MDDPGVAYRVARSAIGPHRRRQAEAALAVHRWLKAHRHVPVSELYGRDGKTLDPELASLEAAVLAAKADVDWCRAVQVAAGEQIKGIPFEEVVAMNEAHRPKIRRAR